MNTFDKTKSDIIDFSKTFIDLEEVFIVRNIYSRFAIYIVANTDKKNVPNFPEELNKQIDSIQFINEKEDNFIYQDLIKSSEIVSESIYFSERHVENTNWFIKDSFKLKAPVTSFYSFKGGVGRTTATILTALLLARQGKKVMIVDFDLEAPGLASIFANQSDNSEELLAVNGFVDFLIDYEANKRDFEKLNLDNYYFRKNEQVLVGTKGGELIIIPAIATDSKSSNSYINKLSKANIRFGIGKEYIPDLFLKKMEEKINPDYILIDTRTGINDVGGLVFNRYAQNIFLLFYGNQQNMFGLESILPQLKELNKKDIRFYLVNSPVPMDETLAKEETNYYVEKSYDIFSNHFYDENNYPSLFDETADHYPINISYNPQALLLNSNRKLSNLIEGNNNPYQEIATIISNDSYKISNSNENTSENKVLIIDSIIKIASGTSEIEFKTEDDLKRLFYPRKDYKYIFEKEKFLILGEKGVGKTALFSVLSHQKYAEELAKYCEISTEEIENTKWIIGLERDNPNFPDKTNFEALSGFLSSEYRNYWILLLIRQLEPSILPINLPLVSEIVRSSIINLKNIAKQENIGEQLMDILYQANAKLVSQNRFFIVVYDHLDAVLPVEKGIRGKLVSALISFYYEYINRFSNLKAKIFLRNDIFEREVKDVTDKVKILNYSQKIEWEYDQLLNVIWKRIYEQGSPLFKDIEFEVNPILGSIPKLTNEKEHKLYLDEIFGKNMGGNNKAYPYNWVRIHIEDTNNKIHPRTLIKLFIESAKLELETKDFPKDRIIRSKNIEKALEGKVSQAQVQELREEYPELGNVFNELYNKVPNGRTPINERDLDKALLDLNEEPTSIIEKLKDIGVLKDYKPYSKTKIENDDRRYHIPDLYLYGLKFTRKGTR